MTPQEAHAQAFENGRKKGNAEGYARGKAEAFAEAGDLISRKALLERLSSRTKTAYPNEFYGLMLAHDFIEEAPAVAAQPVKRGHWIAVEDGFDDDGNQQYLCSCCGVGEKHNTTVLVSYCWNCGADMRGEDDGT